jgi:biopolymer transport protein TolQ
MIRIVSVSVVLAQIGEPAGPGMVEMFLNSGPMAWLVAGLLIGMSLVSWAIMIAKALHLHRASAQSQEFLDVFRRSQRFSEVAAEAEHLQAAPMVGLFRAGYVEIDAQVKAQGKDSTGGQKSYRITSLPALERSLRRAANLETNHLTRGTGFLATTAAAGPFIGLFGTVWGIMNAFQDIGVTGSTSLVAVAPGIAEALINTALGLIAAIPALMGYNYFANRLRELRSQMTDFILEFINLAERNFT